MTNDHATLARKKLYANLLNKLNAGKTLTGSERKQLDELMTELFPSAPAAEEPPPPKKGARPKKIDPIQVRQMAECGVFNADIAKIAGCSVTVLMRRFRKELEQGRAEGRKKLRYLQWDLAKKHHPQILIWLDKQLLGGRDAIDVETNLSEQPKKKVDLGGLSNDELDRLKEIVEKIK